MIERVIEFATELQAAPIHGQLAFQYLRKGNIDVRLSVASYCSRVSVLEITKPESGKPPSCFASDDSYQFLRTN